MAALLQVRRRPGPALQLWVANRVPLMQRMDACCLLCFQRDSAPPVVAKMQLHMLIHKLQELGEENLEERLTSAGRSPARPAHRLAQLIADVVPTGRPVLVLELSRGPGVASSVALGELAAAALVAGADALAVKTDSEDTPEPLKDVLAATQAAAAAFERQRPASRANAFAGSEPAPAPVLQRDWFLHPIQIVNAKEAGAAGILGVIGACCSRLSSGRQTTLRLLALLLPAA